MATVAIRDHNRVITGIEPVAEFLGGHGIWYRRFEDSERLPLDASDEQILAAIAGLDRLAAVGDGVHGPAGSRQRALAVPRLLKPLPRVEGGVPLGGLPRLGLLARQGRQRFAGAGAPGGLRIAHRPRRSSRSQP